MNLRVYHLPLASNIIDNGYIIALTTQISKEFSFI